MMHNKVAVASFIIGLFIAFSHFPTLQAAFDGVCTRKTRVQTQRTRLITNYRKTCGWIFRDWNCWKVSSGKVKQYYLSIYTTKYSCCPDYTGTPNTGCIENCKIRCEIGTCVGRKCTCNDPWQRFSGLHCDQNIHVGSWCNALREGRVDTTGLMNRRASRSVYCNGNRVIVSMSEAIQLSRRFQTDISDSGMTSAERKLVISLWQHHPTVAKFCCNSNSLTDMLESIFNFDLEFLSNELIACPSGNLEIHEELNAHCQSSLDHPFCHLEVVCSIFNIAIRFNQQQKESIVNSNIGLFQRAVKLNFALLKQFQLPQYDDAHFYQINEENMIREITDEIVNLIYSNKGNILKELVFYLPSGNALIRNIFLCENKLMCMFSKMVNLVQQYVQLSTQTSGSKIRKIVETEIDYKELLRQAQAQRIFDQLDSLRASSRSIAGYIQQNQNLISGVAKYFRTIEAYNAESTKTDIDFLQSRIKVYKENVDEIIAALLDDATVIVRHAFNAASLQVSEDTLVLGLNIAGACNPGKKIFGGNGIQDVIQSTAKLANSLASEEAAVALRKAYAELVNETASISEKLDENQELLNAVYVLLNDPNSSSEEYQSARRNFKQASDIDFDPKITKPEITYISALWENFIDKACELIQSTDSTLSAGVKSEIAKSGICWKTKALVQQMHEIYSEIYDYQFVLIDSMGLYVGALIGKEAADSIASDLTFISISNLNTMSFAHLEIVGSISSITYKTHLQIIINKFCDYREYIEGGRRPSACKGVNTDIASLISLSDPQCSTDHHSFYHNIPTTPSSKTDTAFFNLSELYAGNEIKFKIPNSQWLVDKGWILSDERNAAFFIQQFEIYFPIELVNRRNIKVTAKSIAKNAIVPAEGSVEYTLLPNNPLITQYSQGPAGRYSNCHRFRTVNPYTTCRPEEIDSNILCHTEYSNHDVYPSVYSEWKIKAHNIEDIPAPDPANDLYMIIGLKLCKIYESSQLKRNVNIQSYTCCVGNRYYNQQAGVCQDCPAGSTAKLAGYYCEKN